jgi:hypothetical protein
MAREEANLLTILCVVSFCPLTHRIHKALNEVSPPKMCQQINGRFYAAKTTSLSLCQKTGEEEKKKCPTGFCTHKM